MYSPFKIAKKYFQYRFYSSNGKGHGVHSPFVFDFIKNVLNDKKEKECYKEIESIRSFLLKNKSSIEVEDFGAGSGVIKSNTRRVDKIAASSLKPKKYAQLLHRIVNFYKPANIIELGTSFGITTAYLAKGNIESTVTSFEGSDSIADLAQKNFNELSINNIELIRGDFGKTLPVFFKKSPVIDFAFIDGNHRKIPTLDYFTQLLQFSGENTILVFDDIHWSAEMESAWEEIKIHSSVTLSIDLFFIGLVFFKKDFKVKQDFIIQF